MKFLPDKYFDVLCFGHGDPIRTDARRTIADVVRKDAESRSEMP